MSEEYYKITTFDKKNIFQKKNKGVKKIMCRNIIHHGNCSEGSNCHFAHSLDEQVVDAEKRIAYDLIDSEKSLSNINLNSDKQLYDSLKVLTVLCPKCIEKHCSGGYNCRNGACDKKYWICNRDLNYGFCNDQNCELIHLSKRGLKPYYKKDDECKIVKTNILSFFDSINDDDEKIKDEQENEIYGTLLTKKYFDDNKKFDCDSDNNLFESDSDESLYSNLEQDNDRTEEYLYTKSIFK